MSFQIKFKELNVSTAPHENPAKSYVNDSEFICTIAAIKIAK